jgi:hypothetical protein
MILRGILIAASGFIFIFSPGLPIGLLSRRIPTIDRELMYWGIGLWLVALLPSLFVQSLLRQVWFGERALNGQPLDYLFTLLGAFVTASFVTIGMVLVLRSRKKPAQGQLPAGLALGFGVGLVAQVFTGLSLVGAGFRIMYSQTSTPALTEMATAALLTLLLGLVALIVFRPAILLVSAIQGVLAGRSIRSGWAPFILAVLVGAIFTWAILALQMALGAENPGQVLPGTTRPWHSVTTILYYLLVSALAYRWLVVQVTDWRTTSTKGKAT